VSPRLVDVALAYYGEYRDEVDAWLARVRELAAVEEERAERARDALA
jgi:hypothetical protein